MKNGLYLLLCFILVFQSCTSIVEPTIERIEDVDIVEMTRSKLELNAFMIINNPNGFALDLEKADLVAYIDDIELAKIDQTYETAMPANVEFKMPINIKMDLDKLYNDNPMKAMGTGLEIMSKRSLEVRFKGTINVGKGIAKVSVPIDQVEKVKF